MAAASLSILGDNSAVKPLIKLLKKEKNKEVKKYIIFSLGEIKDPQAIKPLIELLKKERTVYSGDDSDFFRVHAAQALGKIGYERAVKPLIEAIQKVHWEDDRLSITRDLIKIVGVDKAIEHYIANLPGNIKKDHVNMFILSIDELKPEWRKSESFEKVIQVLFNYLKNGKIWEKGRAARALIDLNDPIADDILISALENENLPVIYEEYKFFIEKGIENSEPILIKAFTEFEKKFSTHEFHLEMMANTFLNCGNDKLEEFAKAWANSRGYRITYFPSSSGGTYWGRAK